MQIFTLNDVAFRVAPLIGVSLVVLIADRYGTQHSNCDAFRSLFNAAASEKEDMMCLNNRLADVLMKLQKLREEGGQGKDNIAAFLKAIQCLQEEIKKIKICYDNEISKMRYFKLLSVLTFLGEGPACEAFALRTIGIGLVMFVSSFDTRAAPRISGKPFDLPDMTSYLLPVGSYSEILSKIPPATASGGISRDLCKL